jgi:hypothetical protein
MITFPRASVTRWFELRLSEYSTSGWKAKIVKKALLYLPKIGLFLKALGVCGGFLHSQMG